MSGVPLSLFRGGRWYESYDTVAVHHGARRVSIAPEIMYRDELRRIARQKPDLPVLPAARRRAILDDAVGRFRSGRLDLGAFGTQDATGFTRLMREVAGLPETLVQRWVALLSNELAVLGETVPGEPAPDDSTTLIWLPGNTFTCLVAVGEAVLRGGHIVVRPSRHEPFAAARFVAALLAAGWPADRMSFLPTAPAALGPLVTGTDRQIVYGGPDLVSALPPGSTARLDLRGPGRGFAVVGADADPDTTVDRLMDLIAGDSGRFCRNVRTIACLGDPEPLALRLSGALDAVRIDRTDPRWPIAATPAPVAAAYRELIDSRIGAGDRRRTSRPVVVECAGRTFLAPTLVQVAAAGGHPLVGFEVPFPFATITAVDPAAASVLAARSLFTYDLTS